MNAEDDLNKLWEMARSNQQSIREHMVSCGVRNQHRDIWEASVDRKLDALASKVTKINISEARQAGWFAGAAAVGGLIGATAATLVGKLISF